MLNKLLEYAQTNLESEPGFTTKYIRWGIILNENGELLDIFDLADPDDKRKRGRAFKKCPDLSQPELVGGKEARCHYLVESVSIATLYSVQEEELDRKYQEKHAFFLDLLKSSSSCCTELEIIFNGLSTPATLKSLQKRLADLRAKPNDIVTFAVKSGNQFNYVVESNAWHEWWRQFRMGLKTKASADKKKNNTLGEQMISFLSGRLILPVSSNPTIKGLSSVGGLPTGDRMICFDKEAFQSYFLEQSANSAVSEEEAFLYRDALNHLIKKYGRKLVNTMIVHWFKDRIPPEDDLFDLLIETPVQQELTAQNKAKELLNSIQTGKRPDLANNTYYALTLSGASGRVMMRDWMEGSFETLAYAITRWFDDLKIVCDDGSGYSPDPKFMRVVYGMTHESQDLPAPSITQLWNCAVRMSPIPDSFLSRCIERFRVDAIKEERQNPARVGLIKAYHIRKYGENYMSPSLNANHPSPAYQCGRLMAVLADLQRSALGDVGAGVVQRYYAAASTTPSLTLGRLIKLSNHHLNKLDKGLSYWYENFIAEIMSHLGDDLPVTLDLEGQSLFALGYYQQIAFNRSQKSNTKSNNNVEE
ncbi:MAG: type I-C CRISPR-associated protein Cas8c/Csd1 [bacterium]|jgi:CRISPR-associated protein Csd1